MELYSAARDFIGHIDEIAGRDPLESSLGDKKLLPKFVVSSDVCVHVRVHVQAEVLFFLVHACTMYI